MRRLLLSAFTFLALVSSAACKSNGAGSGGGNTGGHTGSTGTGGGSTTGPGGGSTTGPGGGSTMGTGGGAGGSGGATSSTGTGGTAPMGWTAITLADETVDGDMIVHGGDTVAAIWFHDTTHGAVATIAAEDVVAGSIQRMTGPTTIAGVAYTGHHTGFLMQDQSFNSLYATSGGLIAGGDFGDQFISSADNGVTWTNIERGNAASGNIPPIWVSKDASGTWHYADNVGGVWRTTDTPGPAAAWTRTWQPEANPPDPDPVPPEDCQDAFHAGYFAFDPQQVFYVSPDGMTMMYGAGLGDYPSGVCLSTDGGLSFKPVAFPSPPSASNLQVPYVLIFSDPAHGIAAYANDLNDGAAWIYTTSDGGATWAPSMVPASVNAPGAETYVSGGFFAPDGQHVWLVGSTLAGSGAQAVLLKSSDGGHTWKDISDPLRALAASEVKMHTGFALDAKNIWLGGDGGAFFYHPNGGE
jgi:hypothetical protein